MKKKKQMQKSELSARERKELRRKELEREQARDGKTQEERAVRSSRGKVYAIAALVAAVILIAAGVAIPTYMSCNYMFERNPVAVIELDAGGRTFTMKYELYVSDSPIACANFAFLASIDFFDGVVVYDTQNEWARFGGYTLADDDNGNKVLEHRSGDESFTSKQTANFAKEHYTENTGEPDEKTDYSEMFKYQIRSDNPSVKYWDHDFMLCANVSGSAASATEFQISGLKSNMKNEDKLFGASSGASKTFKVVPFGRPLSNDAETSDAVQYILNMQKCDGYMRSYFKTPVETPVIVRNVKIYNYSEEWTNVKYEHGFESYMKEINGFSSTSDTWSKTYI